MKAHLRIFPLIVFGMSMPSFAQGPLPTCFSEAVKTAQAVARVNYPDARMTLVKHRTDMNGPLFRVTISTASEGDSAAALFDVKLTESCVVVDVRRVE